MGVTLEAAKFLFWTREQGVRFERTLTIGRHGLHLPPSQLRSFLRSKGLLCSVSETEALFAEQGGYAEPFFRLLGAEQIDSLDCSDFEGASLVHDMNRPVPPEWHGRFTAIYDGGTLEHVFEFPTALRNCMNLLAVGGHFLSITPANNFFGHGFYQFSPDLFARTFVESNGFRLERLVLFEWGSSRWYEVADPQQVGRRVTLTNHRRTCLAVCARKIEQVELFTRGVQQSDYSEKWMHHANHNAASERICRESLRSQKPWINRHWRHVKNWFRPRYPSRLFKRIDL